MSSKKTHKFNNKLTTKIQHVNKNQQQQQQYFNSHEQLSATSSQKKYELCSFKTLMINF